MLKIVTEADRLVKRKAIAHPIEYMLHLKIGLLMAIYVIFFGYSIREQ